MFQAAYPKGWVRSCLTPDFKIQFHLRETGKEAIMPFAQSGRGAARLARLHGVQEVAGSNPVAPTGKKTLLLQERFLFFIARSRVIYVVN